MNWGSFHYTYIMEIANITHNNSSSNGSSISKENLYTYEVILNLSTVEGQLISKSLFVIFNSSKNKQKNRLYYDASSWIDFVRFLGELKIPKWYFEINWPLKFIYFEKATKFCEIFP